MDKDCIFCKIINNEIPSIKVYENDNVLAFLDISQVTPGHTLLIPKKHIKNILEYNEKLSQDVLTQIPILARAIVKSNDDIKGINILNNNGQLAYQSVFHSHIHFLPRYSKNDDFKIEFKNNSDKYSHEELILIANNIKKHMES